MVLVGLVWTLDFIAGLAPGKSPAGVTAYMFSDELPLALRATSTYHIWLPVFVLWLCRRQGYDDRGAWQPHVWQRWIDADPLTLIRKNREAFAPNQRIYLDVAERDEFLANIGARIYGVVLNGIKSDSVEYGYYGYGYTYNYYNSPDDDDTTPRMEDVQAVSSSVHTTKS